MSYVPFEEIRLAPDRVHFYRIGDTLSMSDDRGTEYSRVILRRCFPMSDENTFLSVRDASTEDLEEIGILEDWSELAPDDRRAVAQELSVFYLVPEIRAIRSARNEFGFLYWEVDTDRGPLEFIMRDQVVRYTRRISQDRWILIDVDQARYEIPQLSALDEHSIKLLERYLSV